MKKLISLLVVLMIVTGCSSPDKASNIDVNQIAEIIINSDIFDGELVKVDESDIKNIYMLKDYDQIVDEAVLYVSGDNNINELAIFKSNGDLQHLLDERIKYLKADASNYFPEQLYKFDDYYLYAENGLYILVVSANNNKIDDLVKSVIN